MDQLIPSNVRSEIENMLRHILTEVLQKYHGQAPEMMNGMYVMSAAGDFCESLKKNYKTFERQYGIPVNDSGLTLAEYHNFVDEVTSKVLDEFLKPPSSSVPDNFDPMDGLDY